MNSDLKSVLLVELVSHWRRGKWINPIVEPLFKKSLVESLSRSDSSKQWEQFSLTTLTAKRYLNLEYPVESARPRCLDPSVPSLIDSTADHRDFWESAVAQNKRKAILGTFSLDESALLNQALRLIQNTCEVTYVAFLATCRFICKVETEQFSSSSNPHFYGTIFIRPQGSVESVALSLVHELAHHELFLVNLVDRLVNEKHERNLVYAPFQKVERPPIGRLHSAHALYRMLQFEAKMGVKSSFQHHEDLRTTVLGFTSDELTPWVQTWIHGIYLSEERSAT